jgi:septal ring factor EnvC (AmiA/AmiB activator)
MSDFFPVEAPTLAPHGCIICQSTKAPLIDTRRTIADQYRIYICKLCAKQIALLFGFAKGAELDRLMEVAAVIEEKEKELRQAQKNVTDLEVRLKEQITMKEDVADELAVALDTIALHERRAQEMSAAINAAAGHATQPVEAA